MDLKQSMHLGQRLEQRLVMTQQLQQAIRLLQLSRMELLETVQSAMTDNPMLEEDNEQEWNRKEYRDAQDAGLAPQDAPVVDQRGSLDEGADSEVNLDAPTVEPIRPEQTVDWANVFESDARDKPTATEYRTDDEDRPSVEQTLKKGTSLYDHLMWQLQVSGWESLDAEVAAEIIGNVDENGYLRENTILAEGSAAARAQLAEAGRGRDLDVRDDGYRVDLMGAQDDEIDPLVALGERAGLHVGVQRGISLKDVADRFSLGVAFVRAVLARVQELDPPGVAARDLRECLMMQARLYYPDNTALHGLVDRHLGNLERRNHGVITRELHITLDELHRLAKLVASFEPKPGRAYTDERPHYITPDIFVVRVGDGYEVFLNEDGLPRLRVSKYYKDAMTSEGVTRDARHAKDYINEKLKSAVWLIRSIQQRQSTILKVTEAIIRFQREFLDKGLAYLRPLVLRDIAEEVGIHESTVSRVTTNKYVHTPQGIFELKYFFNSRITVGGGGDDVASETVKQAIKRLIDREDQKAPLSDQEIADILQSKWDRGRVLGRLRCAEQEIDEVLPRDPLHIARRTVAKYRESMDIAPSAKRRPLF